jgi:hypothetical protein
MPSPLAACTMRGRTLPATKIAGHPALRRAVSAIQASPRAASRIRMAPQKPICTRPFGLTEMDW